MSPPNALIVVSGGSISLNSATSHRRERVSRRQWSKCLVIQCKWQVSTGSVEENYPFQVLSIQLNEFDTIIVLDGGG